MYSSAHRYYIIPEGDRCEAMGEVPAKGLPVAAEWCSADWMLDSGFNGFGTSALYTKIVAPVCLFPRIRRHAHRHGALDKDAPR